MDAPGVCAPLRRFFGRSIRRSFGDLAIRDEPAAEYLADLLTRSGSASFAVTSAITRSS